MKGMYDLVTNNIIQVDIMGKYKVVITDQWFGSVDKQRKILSEIDADLYEYQIRDEEEIIKAAHDCDALMFQYAKIPKSLINRLEKCKVIAKFAKGIDSIDIDACTSKNICFTNVDDYCTDEVSTHALSLLLAVNRKLMNYNKSIRNGIWDYKLGGVIQSLKESKVGVISYGKIARAFVEKLKPLCNNIWVVDPFITDDVIKQSGVEPKTFEEIIQNCDYISIHAPLTEETKHLFNKEVFKKMKNTASIINVARGPLVNMDDLAWALHSGEIAYTAMDVLEIEPPPKDHPILSCENIVLTPHSAWYSNLSEEIMITTPAEEIVRVLTGQKPKFLVNKELEIN